MNEHRLFFRYSIRTVILLIAMLASTTLVACGILEVSVNQTPEVSLASGTVAVQTPQVDGLKTKSPDEETSVWGPLETYTHPVLGYKIPIPQSATSHEDELGENITFFSDRGWLDNGPSYLISVQVFPGTTLSAQKLAEELAFGESEPSAIETFDPGNGKAPGAFATYTGGTGTFCPELRFLLATFVEQDTGYAIRIGSDGPERCDAGDLPEALAIVNGFQPAVQAPILAMTPTPTPAQLEGLVVVYAKDNNVWLWTESEGESQLTKDGGVDQLWLSDDKVVIAFRRGNGLWAVNADGTGERKLVDESDLPLPSDEELASFVTGMAPYQVAWILGTHQLLFNTLPEVAGPGLFLSDDLWLVDADSLALTNLFTAGEGGNFVVSPDGRQVALITPENISLATVTGGDKRQILSYTPVATYSEVRYYARPVWSPASDALAVAIPPPDSLGSEIQSHSVWSLNTDGKPAGLVGSIETRGNFPGLAPVISPNLDQIAYLSSTEATPDRTDLLFVSWDESLGDPTFYTSEVDSFVQWSPAGQRFSFNRPPAEVPAIRAFTGRLGEEPQIVGDGDQPAIEVRWVDDESYLYLQASAKGWDLLLTDSAGNTTLVAAVVGAPPAIDVMQ